MSFSLYTSRNGNMASIAPLALFLGLAVAQSPDSARNCTSNEILSSTSGVSYSTMNATGSFEYKGFRNQNSDSPMETWTWSTGVQNIWNFTNNRTFFYEQPVWIDTHGTDLASDDLGYEMCHLTLLDFPQSLQKSGHGDSGDCTTFFNLQCVDDWKKALTEQGVKHIRSNSTDLPCQKLLNFTPPSCKDFGDGSRATGQIPLANRSCPLGLGSPDYDSVLRVSMFASDAAAKNDTKDFSVYDEVTTRILPVFALAWSTNATVDWSDARIMCLRTPNIAKGSREPSGVPGSSSIVRVDVFVLVGSLLMLLLL